MKARGAAGRREGWMYRLPVPEGIRITTVGLWYVLLSVLVAIAATNTGNNALYTVLAMMFAVLILSGVLSRDNVRGLAIDLEPPGEIFANRPVSIGFTIVNRGRLTSRWFLLFSLSRTSQQRMLVPYLARRGRSAGRLTVMIPTRGRHDFPFAHVSSLFPFGFFRKGVRYRTDLSVLVFPELFAAANLQPEAPEQNGNELSRRVGRGHDLHSLRTFRQGDDPRGIHWKQTAKTGGMVFMEREAEESRRLSILFDNAVGELATDEARGRFERLVSEAATAAIDHLARGFDVELVTRDGILPFASGGRQRLRLLESLALVAPQARQPEPLLASDPRAARLHVHLEPAGEASAPPEVTLERGRGGR